MSINMSIYMSTYICFNKYVNIYVLHGSQLLCLISLFSVLGTILVQTKIDVRLSKRSPNACSRRVAHPPDIKKSTHPIEGAYKRKRIEKEKVGPPPRYQYEVSFNACSRRGKSSPPHRRSIEEEKDRKV